MTFGVGCLVARCLCRFAQIGLGIHGEAGIRQTKLQSANDLTDIIIAAVVDPPNEGEQAAKRASQGWTWSYVRAARHFFSFGDLKPRATPCTRVLVSLVPRDF